MSDSQRSPQQKLLLHWKRLAQDGDKIQSGGQGTVVSVDDGKHKVAVKYMAASKKRGQFAEVTALRRLDNSHPHIVFTHGMLRGASGSVYIMQERAVCDVHDAASEAPDRKMGEGSHVREWMLQVAHALSHCHDKLLAHRDIKPENLLLVPSDPALEIPSDPSQDDKCLDLSGSAEMSRARLHAAIRKCYASPMDSEQDTPSTERWRTSVRKSVVAKVCDFGAAFLDRLPEEGPPTRNAHSACGSRSYCDPEVYRIMAFQSMATQAARVWDNSQGQWQEIVDTGYDPYAADVWSFGVVVFTLVTGSKPFHAPCIADNVFRAFLRATQPEVVHDEICAPWCERWLEDCLPGSSGTLKPGLETWEWPSSMSPELVDLLGKCMRLRSSERISMEAVLQHPWMTSPLSKGTHKQAQNTVAEDAGTDLVSRGATRPRNSSSASAAPSSASMVSVKRDVHSAAHADTMSSPTHAALDKAGHSPQNHGIALRSSPSTEENAGANAGAGAQLDAVEHNIPAAATGRITAVKLQEDADELEAQLRESGDLQPIETRPDLMASMCTPATEGNTVSLSVARSNSSAHPMSPTGASGSDRSGGTVWKFSFPAPAAEQAGADGAQSKALRINTGATTRPNRRFSGSQQRKGDRSYNAAAFERPVMPSGILSPHGNVTTPGSAGAAAGGRPPRFTFSKSGIGSLEPSPTAAAAPVPQPTAESCASSDAGEAGDVLSPLVAKLRLPAVPPTRAVVAGNVPAGGSPNTTGGLKPIGAMVRSGSSSSSTGHAPPFQLRGSGSLDASQHPRLDPSNSGTRSMLRHGSSGISTGK